MTQAEASKKIKELTKIINFHNKLYYQQNRTEISDAEFDALMAELIILEKDFPTLRSPDSPT